MHSGTGQPKDSGRRRDADAARVRRAAAVRFAGLGRLHFYTFPLYLPEGVSIYSLEASRTARAFSETIFGSTPARWKLEQGDGGNHHVHIIAPLPPVAVCGFDDVRLVYKLRGLLAYFAKPVAAPLCKQPLKPWTPDAYTRAQRYRDALQEQCDERARRRAAGFSRLPPAAGWTGRRASNVDHLLTLRCALAFALLALCALLTPAPALTPAPRRASPFLNRTAPRSPYRPRPRAPDRSTQGLAR